MRFNIFLPDYNKTEYCENLDYYSRALLFFIFLPAPMYYNRG